MILFYTMFSKLSAPKMDVSGTLLVCLFYWYKRLNTQRSSADVHNRGEECQEQWRQTGADGIQASIHPLASDGGKYLGHISL